MFIAGSRPDLRDDTRRNYHRCSVRVFSWANKSGALGVVYSDGHRLWLDARGFTLNDGTCSNACGFKPLPVSAFRILIKEREQSKCDWLNKATRNDFSQEHGRECSRGRDPHSPSTTSKHGGTLFRTVG